MNSRTSLVATRGLSKHYPPSTWALRDANLTIQRGESIAIVGPSGSGKSTLLAVLGLLETPSAGTYELDGLDVAEASPRHRIASRRDKIGFVFQAFHLVPHLTALENVMQGYEIKRGRRGALEAARDYLARVGLAGKEEARPLTLSGGEQQRVAIARALVAQPPLVLCDEPTGNLDSANSALVLEQLMHTVSPSSALVIVTHDSAVADLCARTVTVSDGRVTETD